MLLQLTCKHCKRPFCMSEDTLDVHLEENEDQVSCVFCGFEFDPYEEKPERTKGSEELDLDECVDRKPIGE